MGATGNIGGSVAETLLAKGHEVKIVTRSAEAGARWFAKGAQAAIVDVDDTEGMRQIFRSARRAFMLNPPAPPFLDTVAEERRTLAKIVEAAKGADLEQVVVQSTYGARPGEGCGDLNVLYEFEQAISALFPTTVVRAGFYMSNWKPMIDAVRSGVLRVVYPADLEIPMVAPGDIGKLGAELLEAEGGTNAIHYIEGPQRYTSRDAAQAFANALGIDVRLEVTPRENWEQAFKDMDFSASATQAYIKMMEVIVDKTYDVPADHRRGTTTLQDYVNTLVAN